MKRITLFALLTALFARSAAACDLCAVYAATQAQGESGIGFFAGVAEQFTHFGTLQYEGTEVPNEAGQRLDSSISQLFVGYNITPRVGVQFNLPVIYRSFKRVEESGIERGTESGLGDAALIGNFLAYQKVTADFDFRWHVTGGVKFPTGSTDRLFEETQEHHEPGEHALEAQEALESGIHGHDLTLGTGSFDGIIGTGVFTRWKRAFLTASLQYAIRGEGDFDYRFANDLTWSGGPGVYVLLKHQYTLALQAVVSGETKGRDTFQGAKAEDTGITAVYLGPRVNFTWGGRLSAEAGADLPVSIDNTALQIVPDYRLRGGLTWRF